MASDVSPTARALLALESVQNQPGITAERLGERLGVTARAARRYVAILREAGVPIESVSGPAGGYRPGRGLRPPPLSFSSIEALALVLAVLDGHHDAGDPTDSAGSALAKLLRALPASVAAQAEMVRRTAVPAPDAEAARPDPSTTAALVQACATHRRLRLAYRSAAGHDLDPVVDPWAVVVRHARWYLVCRTVDDAPAHRGLAPAAARPTEGPGVTRPRSDLLRALRVDRVRAVEVIGDGVPAPVDLEPVPLLEELLGAGRLHETSVIIDAPIGQVAPRLPRVLGRLEALDAESVRLVGSTSDPRWYACQLAAVPVAYRVEGDEALRVAVRELGERALRATGRRRPRSARP